MFYQGRYDNLRCYGSTEYHYNNVTITGLLWISKIARNWVISLQLLMYDFYKFVCIFKGSCGYQSLWNGKIDLKFDCKITCSFLLAWHSVGIRELSLSLLNLLFFSSYITSPIFIYLWKEVKGSLCNISVVRQSSQLVPRQSTDSQPWQLKQKVRSDAARHYNQNLWILWSVYVSHWKPGS